MGSQGGPLGTYGAMDPGLWGPMGQGTHWPRTRASGDPGPWGPGASGDPGPMGTPKDPKSPSAPMEILDIYIYIYNNMCVLKYVCFKICVF